MQINRPKTSVAAVMQGEDTPIVPHPIRLPRVARHARPPTTTNTCSPRVCSRDDPLTTRFGNRGTAASATAKHRVAPCRDGQLRSRVCPNVSHEKTRGPSTSTGGPTRAHGGRGGRDGWTDDELPPVLSSSSSSSSCARSRLHRDQPCAFSAASCQMQSGRLRHRGDADRDGMLINGQPRGLNPVVNAIPSISVTPTMQARCK